MKSLFITPLLLFSLTAQSGTPENFEVVFLSQRDGEGRLVDLEPTPLPRDHAFFHVAIREVNQAGEPTKWLHAHPRGGVQRSARIESFGEIELIVKFQTLTALPFETWKDWVGLPYESDYGWESEALYCSKLVGKILGMRPSKMKFEGPYWERYFAQTKKTPPQGVGISPDGLYSRILQACRRQVLINCEFIRRDASDSSCTAALSPL